MKSHVSGGGDSGPQTLDSSESRRDGGQGWSRRTFLTGTAMTVCSLATARVDAFGVLQAEGAARAKGALWYSLNVPDETSGAVGADLHICVGGHG